MKAGRERRERPGVREERVRPDDRAAPRDTVVPGDRKPGGGALEKKSFDQLADGVPLALLPVRLETVFAREGEKRLLKVRIYPDTLHVDGHQPELTDEERSLGRSFWDAHARGEGAARVTRTMLERDPWRAEWVLRATRPGGPPAEARPGGAVVRCMPRRWAIVGLDEVDGAWVEQFTAFTSAVRADLSANLLPAEGEEVDPKRLLGQGSSWVIDYDEAVKAGMAVTIELEPANHDGVGMLLALGLRGASPSDDAEALRALLDAHRFTDGLSFASQGEPTNNTDEAAAADPTPAGAQALLRRVEGASGPSATLAAAALAAGALGLSTDSFAGVDEPAHDEEASAKDMNEVLWPVTLGQYFHELLANSKGQRAVPDGAIRRAERLWLDHVRGGAPLPTLRVGDQPYGLLPTMLVERREPSADPDAWLDHILLDFLAEWQRSLDAVPRLDPVRGALGPEADDPDATLLAVLAALPHPKRFAVRRLRDWREEHHDVGPIGVLAIFGVVWLGFADPIWGHQALSVLGRWGWARHVLDDGRYVGLRHADLEPLWEGVGSAADQLRAIDALSIRVGSLGLPADKVEPARAWLEAMRGMVEQHRARQHPLDELGAPVEMTGILDGQVDDPTLFYSLYDEDDAVRRLTRPLVRGRGKSPSAYLRALATEARGGASAEAPEDLPLLFQLARAAIGASTSLPPAQKAPRRFGEPQIEQKRPGSGLASPLDRLAELPADTLDLRLRETLGLATNRLDAWFTARAREKLLARDAKTGLQVGGYGVVFGLRPGRRGAREAGGFLHAPSLQQATTAAVLRSGYDSEQDASLAVDLSSERVRLARELFDGVRHGQDLGALLGALFERRLQDLGQQRWLAPVRDAVAAHAGEPRHGPVDGLELLDANKEGALDDVLRDADGAGDGADVRDAAGDAATAEAVHQLLMGNDGRVAATLDAIALGEAAPPELSFPTTPRPSTAVVHRVFAAFSPSASPAGGWSAAGARATYEPGLNAWVSSLLPRASDVAVRGSDGHVTLGDLSLSALDVVYTAADQLSKRLAEAAGLPEGEPAAPEPVSLEELAELTGALRKLLAGARPLGPEHLALPGAAIEASWDLDELEARLATLEASARAEGLGNPDGLAAARATWGAATTGAERTTQARLSLEFLLGRDFPLLPRFVPEGAPPFTAPTASGPVVLDWLAQEALVRAPVAELTESFDLAELLGGRPPRPVVDHGPRLEDVWLAHAKPAPDTGPRVCWTSLGAALTASSISGLLFDGWTESIPHEVCRTGVALQFDAPSARPPQAILLAMPPDGRSWDFDLVRDTVVQALDLARIRAIGPEGLDAWGHHLPAVFVPGGIDASEA